MKALLLALFTMLTAWPAAAQERGVFIGVDDDPVLGSPDAKVLMIEFGDYQCPSCRMFWKDIEPRLKKDYIDTGKVKLMSPQADPDAIGINQQFGVMTRTEIVMNARLISRDGCLSDRASSR